MHYNEDLHGLKTYEVISFLLLYQVWFSGWNALKNEGDIKQLPGS